MNATWLFRGAVAFSVVAHGALLAARTAESSAVTETMVKVPVLIEAEVEPPPPPSPPPPEAPKPRPRKLARHIDQVVESDGMRAGELVDAEVGDYAEPEVVEPDPPPVLDEPPPEPPPRPKPKPKPTVDKRKLARAYLQNVRGAIAAAKQYPFRAQRMGIGGAVALSFVVLADSRFGEVSVKRSSGYDVLDQAALFTVQSLSGHLARPPEIGDTPLRASITLRYQLEAQHGAVTSHPHQRHGRHRHHGAGR